MDKIKKEIDWTKKSVTLIAIDPTFTELIDRYEDYIKSQRLCDNTISMYLRTLHEFGNSLTNSNVKRIHQRNFTSFKNSMPKLSDHTINRKLRTLQTFFNWLFDENYIDNPVRIKKLPVIEPPINYYSNVEFKLILENVKDGFPFKQVKTIDGDKELFLKAYWLYRDTGIRLAEPFDNELKMDDDGYRLKIIGSTTKNSYLRYVHLTEQQGITIIQMNEWQDRQLKRRKNRYGTIQVFSRVFARALKKERIKGDLHDLRKTFASRLWYLTGQEFALCHVLGHTDTSMTKKYTILDKVELSRAFPDITKLKNSNFIEDDKVLKGSKKGDVELYSNFGFMHVCP